MKNNLADLSNHLFETLELIGDENLSDEELEKVLKRAKSACDVSTQILKVAGMQISAIKMAESAGLCNEELPSLIAVKDSKARRDETQKLIGVSK